ncbi:hypothetical protein EVJ32_10605 [Exiguobacterium sp. SH5S4]|uniref:hypothetical protein n=1 Tax=Exiguobacterium sp. SH5S4 TaxID=2510961 RepID=UPI0010403752|nr:hypothetical protein [Exiguobacterium sp. SH5S4]TCI25402.1 hypothetical protein EVJ32_10605 [Exiguobacterium sp. SH5S4]
MKKLTFLILGFIVIVWIGVSVSLPPKLEATSDDGRWKAEYNVGHSAKGTWKGDLYWKNVEGKMTSLVFYQDGDILTGDLVWSPAEYVDLNTLNQTEFIYLGEKPKKDATYTLHIKWLENGKEFEQVLDFNEKRRLFVIPRLD